MIDAKRWTQQIPPDAKYDGNSVSSFIEKVVDEINCEINTNEICCVKKIISVNGLSAAPKKIELFGEWYECTIEIGKDNTARMLIDYDAFAELTQKD